MIKNYFKIALRNLIKDRQFTILNLVGLSAGLACSLMIFLWINDEINKDKYNDNDQKLYQVMQNISHDGIIETTENTGGLLANALKTELPEVEYATTVVPPSWFSSKGIVAFNDKRLKVGGQFISKDYFNIFTCNFLEGNKSKIYSDKHSIAISDDLAVKLFHTTHDVIGKTIEWNQDEFDGSYIITGVFKKKSGQRF